MLTAEIGRPPSSLWTLPGQRICATAVNLICQADRLATLDKGKVQRTISLCLFYILLPVGAGIMTFRANMILLLVCSVIFVTTASDVYPAAMEMKCGDGVVPAQDSVSSCADPYSTLLRHSSRLYVHTRETAAVRMARKSPETDIRSHDARTRRNSPCCPRIS